MRPPPTKPTKNKTGQKTEKPRNCRKYGNAEWAGVESFFQKLKIMSSSNAAMSNVHKKVARLDGTTSNHGGGSGLTKDYY